MKKRTKRVLPIWIVLLVLGILFQVLGKVLHFPSWTVWLTSSLCWGSAVIWIGLHFIPGGRRKPRGSEAFAGNGAVYGRVSREIIEATSRYLQSVKRKGLLKRSALYERPWFLVCGPEKSGKTQLLSGSGLPFPLKYPSEKDGMILEEGSGISWNFGNDAVWVDMPGVLMEDSGTEEWRATVNAIREVRSERAIDGVVMVVNAARIMETDQSGIKEMAGSLRKRLDELIATWGIEFPVYLIISRSDEITGFNELFHDPAGKWSEQILGATLSGAQQMGLPRHAFAEEYEHLCVSLRDMRLEMLAKEKDEQRRRLICRFVIHFEGLQQKLANFIAELFKPSSYEGKPVFSGFYFTSCQTVQSEEAVEPDTPIDVSETIIKHPLNPHRVDKPEVSFSGKIKKEEILPFFTHTLFKEVIPAGVSLVKKTQRFSRRELIRHYGLSAVITVLALLIGWYIFLSAKNSISLNNEIKREINQAKGEAHSRAEAYRMLGAMGHTVFALKKIHDKGAPFSMGMGFYKDDRVFHALNKEYFKKVKKLIVGPSMRYLEYKIKRYSESFGELSGDEYNELYKVLKAYLSISEAVSGHLEQVDTISLRPVLLEAVKYVLLSSEKKSRLSQNVETILQNNISLYMSFLRNAEFPLIQENQHLVARARKRLCRLPNAQVLYESVINRLSTDAHQISLDEILGRDGAGILQSANTISVLYTQEGWNQNVSNAVKDASKDPYKIDWVIGTTKDQMPKTDLDHKKVHQDMVAAYFRDVKDKWLLFISSVNIEPFGDIARSGRILQKLGRDQSELVKFFEKIAKLTQIKEKSDKGLKVPGVVSKAASKKTRKIKKLGMDPGALLNRKMSADYLADSFEPLRSFIRSDKGALGGLEGYRDKIVTLSEKLSTIQSLDGDNVVAVFNGKDTDPLFDAWTFTKNELTGMPDELAHSLEKLLLSPISHTGRAVSNVLTKQLNSLWQNDVVTMFTNRFAGRYPFSPYGDEALFDDVMDFFRPSTGILWGFYDRRLSPFIVKKNTKWHVRKIGSIEVGFNPKLIETLKKAEKVRYIFFQPDGTLRIQKLTMLSVKTNKNRAVFKIGDREFTLVPGGEGEKAQFRWPVETGSKDVSLKIYANDNVAKDFSYPGEWGLIQLFEEARINIVNQRTFIAKWQVNVQNMYMIYFACRINVAGSDHPFSERVFNGFDCPMNITEDKKL